jgi:hypothetical protein
MYLINEMQNDSLALFVGSDVFVLGYPFGIGPAGLPIWKRGSIASEPQIFSETQRYMLVDTASRPGMSGSPVIRRTWGAHPLESGTLSVGARAATRFVGVYSGRLTSTEPIDAQLGMVWPAKLIGDIVAGHKVDS